MIDTAIVLSVDYIYSTLRKSLVRLNIVSQGRGFMQSFLNQGYENRRYFGRFWF